MKIKNISCNQFAGVRNRSITLSDGINVIYGKNESGKSTVVNLISRVLFQNAKLDRRKDKDFYELYFPAERKGSSFTGDSADGEIIFETESGTYKINKEWGVDPRCVLSAPEGVIRDQTSVDAVLKEQLLYGEGVYAEMLLSSQRNTDISLQTILDASQKTYAKQEICDAVSLAFAESDGISVDAIDQAIKAKIDELAGKHWDLEREAPVRKAGRWSQGLGEILKAFYELEDAKNALEEISHLENDADRAASAYAENDIAVCVADEAYKRFNEFASRLAVQNERKKAINRINEEIRKIAGVLESWPNLNEKLEKAKSLEKELGDRCIYDRWNFVCNARAEITAEDEGTAALCYPDATVFARIKKLQREIASLENQLCGMNLNAAIQMFNGALLTVTSLRTGEKIDVSNGVAAITEAVQIEIPDVMKMQLSPADVDIASVKEKIAQEKDELIKIFEEFSVDSLDALEAYARRIDDARVKIERVNAKVARALGDVKLCDLEEAYEGIDSVTRNADDIKRDIFAVCGATEVSLFIAKNEAVVDGYASEYGSINDLKARAFDLSAELKKAEESVCAVEDIPTEYMNISDPEAYLKSLQDELRRRQELSQNALAEKSAAASKLDTYKELHPEACLETVIKAEKAFEETKSLLAHWLHIEEVFNKQKENINNNPMQDIAESFARYLGIISEGRVSSEFPEADKLNMNIYSADLLLDYKKLSEGTKETVSLAWRLAVLDHLFPNGGGVIVLDDPFTDMDAERTARSCALIQECALRHQVIFLTCKEEYLDIAGVNKIYM